MHLVLSTLILICAMASAQEPPKAPTPEPGAAPQAEPEPQVSTKVAKVIDLEWDPVENAGSYEVKLTPEGETKFLIFNTVEAHLHQQVPIGNYDLQVRARSKDGEDVSPWSERMPLAVAAKELVQLMPEDGAILDGHAVQKQTVEFRWTAVDRVKKYTLMVWSEDRKDQPWIFTSTTNSKKIDVPPAQVYFWQVKFESADDVAYQQQPKTYSFTLLGAALIKPEILLKLPPPPNEFAWKESPDAKEYHAKLFFHYLDEEEWTLLREEKLTATHWPIPKPLKPGAYKLEVQATAPRHVPSELAVREFLIKPPLETLTSALQQASFETPR